MKRLSKMRLDDDPLCREAARLLTAVEALPASEERMLRVRRGIERKKARRATLWRGPRALALAAGMLVFAGSTLAAAQSGVLQAVIASVSSVVQVGRPAALETRPASRATKRRSSASNTAAPAPSEAPAAEGALPSPQAEPAAITPDVVTEPVAHAKHELVRRRARERVLAENNELVRRAVKALRRDHDATLAARLLEEAHVKSPNGALAEEVMSLRVEAALALNDARAPAYAREYLAAYPSGRYRARVEQALR